LEERGDWLGECGFSGWVEVFQIVHQLLLVAVKIADGGLSLGNSLIL